MDLFCSECVRELLCEEEIGRIDKRYQNLAGSRHTTKTTLCVDCVNDEDDVIKKIDDTQGD